MQTPVSWWVGFNVVVAVLLAADLGVFQRGARVISPRAAGIATAVWVTLSLLFCAAIWKVTGQQRAVEFATGYVVEYALSVDNLFVFLMLFGYFKIKPEYQHRLLYWGVIGAFVMRATLILAGTALVSRFHFLMYGFGAFLLFSAWKILFSGDDDAAPGENRVLNWGRRVLPVARQDAGGALLVVEDGRRKFAPLFLVLLVVETTDLLFALDSIPAILGISRDPFIVYTSNVCAVLGLRSLFFLVAALMSQFHFLKLGLAAVLSFVGVKMLTEQWVPLSQMQKTLGSLGVIVLILVVAVVASVLRPAQKHSVVEDKEKFVENAARPFAHERKATSSHLSKLK